MDAVKFVETLQRKIKNENRDEIIIRTTDDANLFVDLVEEWAKENYIKTRQSKFLEMFPNASLIANGTLEICPKSLDKDRECLYSIGCDNNKFVDCLGCRNKFWFEEVD